ncbi:MAG TPA: hypothetical protein PLA53_01365 [bacterium]|jgi:hypothetical protein|nr:hypothetical protein [bacterium]HNZ51302.1 hypothetical protein [bacterium]HOH85231.1 hypothetical protein [bacterium]HPX64067.1 hypothetical protein [bacterium]HQA84250.1 hypothetical protein [bacterium]
MFNPEQFLKRQAEKQESRQNFHNEDYLNQLLSMANAANKIDRIQYRDFVDLYGEEAVKKDISWVKQQKIEHQKKNSPSEIWHKKIADILEAIFHQQIEMNNYFGENVWTIKTCNYDDFYNHIDAILEIRNPDQKSANYSGVALDVTSASHPERLAKKVDRILEKIKRGELAKVKYFQSEFLNIRGEKSNVPLFVIGCDLKHTEELAKLWYNDKQRALAQHPIQVLLLNQIIQQAQLYRDYAKKANQAKIADIYQQILDEFTAIADERQPTIEQISQNPANRQFFTDDTVSANLEKIIQNYVGAN